MRIIAFYLPQYHAIPENNQWWGAGFTDWDNVRSAEPLYPGHRQPRVPLHGNYYTLDDDSVIEWQMSLAKKYGVYGFCIYHYWFSGRKLLEKPLERIRNNPKLNLPYCICWADESWTDQWIAEKDHQELLIEQTYGDESEWKDHFEYLLTFFVNDNYITNEGKPLLVLYRPELIPRLNDRLDYWTELAKASGFGGIDYACQTPYFLEIPEHDDSRFEYFIEYQPILAYRELARESESPSRRMKSLLYSAMMDVDRTVNADVAYQFGAHELRNASYEEVCEAVVNHRPSDDRCIPGMFVDWDNTPRYAKLATVARDSTPAKFEKYLSLQISNAHKYYNTDMMFLFAWNEWGEGGYLEPDQQVGYGYLEAIRAALDADSGYRPS